MSRSCEVELVAVRRTEQSLQGPELSLLSCWGVLGAGNPFAKVSGVYVMIWFGCKFKVVDSKAAFRVCSCILSNSTSSSKL